jgi:hypothetical protein
MKTIIKPVLAGLYICLSGILVHAQSLATKSTGASTITENVKFNYGGYQFTDELVFKTSDYNYYKKLGKREFEPNYAKFATENEDHAYIKNLSKTLDVDAKKLGLKGMDLVEYLTAFAQQAVPYATDPENDGFDYPRYPIETLVDGKGDCEDKAALLVALLNEHGFNAILLSPPGHMAVGIECENCDEGVYELNGKKYVYVETSVKGWPIGKVPSQFAAENVMDAYKP